MKTISNGVDVLRVNDKMAREIVSKGGWVYRPKKLYYKPKNKKKVDNKKIDESDFSFCGTLR